MKQRRPFSLAPLALGLSLLGCGSAEPVPSPSPASHLDAGITDTRPPSIDAGQDRGAVDASVDAAAAKDTAGASDATASDATASDVAAREPGAIHVSGRVTYDFVPVDFDPTGDGGALAFDKAMIKPVRGGVVRAMAGGTMLATTTTRDDGGYDLDLPAGTTQATVLALARTTTPAITVQDNTDRNAVWTIALPVTVAGLAVTADLHATHGWNGSSYDATRRTAAPFAVLDAILTAERAFLVARPLQFPPLKVCWSPNNAPEGGDPATGAISNTLFDPGSKQIFLLGKAGVDTDEFDRHVILHEWGHWLQDNFSRLDSPGGDHPPEALVDPRLSFSEAWGDALPSMVLGETYYFDTVWSGGRLSGAGWDLEAEPVPTDAPSPGAFSEVALRRLIYDVFDAGTNEPYDRVAAGLGTIYDVMAGPVKQTDALCTIAPFIAGLEAQPGIDVAAVDALLAHSKIGPIRSDLGDGDPPLRALYRDVPALPYSTTVTLAGGEPSNRAAQNQYLVFSGNGARITISARSSKDVTLEVSRRGEQVEFADRASNGSETLSFNSTAGARYLVLLNGLADTRGAYQVTVSLESP